MSQPIGAELVSGILRLIGEDPTREGLRDTPDRVVRSWVEMFCGYSQDPQSVLKSFEDGCVDEMIVIRKVEFYSACEHHMLPFSGMAHFGYIPGRKIVGLSKIGRLIDVFARRLQVQERLTTQIVEAFVEGLQPKGAGCIIEANHMCLMCRGIMKQRAMMVTSCLRGVFKDDPKTRAEFLQFVHNGRA